MTAGCAVATVDPDGDESGAGVGDGDGDAVTNSGGASVVTSGGTTSGPSGGTLNTGGTLSTGGTLNTGGTTPGSGGNAPAAGGATDPGGCLSLDAGDKESGSFGTTGAFCIIVDFTGMMYGWRASGAAGRTITINGEQVGTGDINPGAVPMPGSSPYLVEFSAGDHDYCDFAFW
jgi:hypothetical protein